MPHDGGRPGACRHHRTSTGSPVSRITPQRAARRPYTAVALTAAALAASIAFAVPASAHVEVEAAGARALDENVTLDFTAETESDRAGISKLEVVLPQGITPADVTYVTGPKGWSFAATEGGYAVSGPKLPVGEDAEYSVRVRQLPYIQSLAFKTLQTYSDGRVDRWIALDAPEDGGHGNPAPVLELAPAAPGAEPVATDSAPAATGSPTSAPDDAGASASRTGEGTPTTGAPPASGPGEIPEASGAGAADRGSDDAEPALIIGFVVLVVALVGGMWWLRRGSGARKD